MRHADSMHAPASKNWPLNNIDAAITKKLAFLACSPADFGIMLLLATAPHRSSRPNIGFRHSLTQTGCLYTGPVLLLDFFSFSFYLVRYFFIFQGDRVVYTAPYLYIYTAVTFSASPRLFLTHPTRPLSGAYSSGSSSYLALSGLRLLISIPTKQDKHPGVILNSIVRVGVVFGEICMIRMSRLYFLH